MSENTPKNKKIDPTPSLANTWLQGESILINYTYPNSIIDGYQKEGGTGSTYTITGDYTDTFTSAGYYKLYFNTAGTPFFDNSQFSSPSDQGEAYVIASITAKLDGKLIVDGRATASYATVSSANYNAQAAVSISEEYRDANNKLTVAFVAQSARIDSSTYSVAFQIFALNRQTLLWDKIYVTQQSTSIDTGAFSYIYIYLQQIYYAPNVYSEIVRSEYILSNSNAIIHRIVIQIYDYSVISIIYSSPEWNLTAISPSASFFYNSSSGWTVTYGALSTYTLTFVSGPGWGVDYRREPYILGISQEYEYRFEGNTKLKERSDSSYGYDSYALNTSIVQDGIYSLRVSDSDTNPEQILLPELPAGEYYISFGYYWDTVAPSWSITPRLANYKSTTTDPYIELDLTPNRWQTAYTLFKITDSLNRDNFDFNLYFSMSQSSGVYTLYIDSIRIYTANPDIQTTGYNSYTLSTTMSYWNPYGLFPASQVDVNLELRDRTANTAIQNWGGVTDVNGYYSVIFQGSLDQREYEIRS